MWEQIKVKGEVKFLQSRALHKHHKHKSVLMKFFYEFYLYKIF